MDRQSITKALDRLIANETLQVAALSGVWGVGKTYLWRDYAQDLKLPSSMNGVAYASLFGASSLDDVRSRVAEGLQLSRNRDDVRKRYKKESSRLLLPRELPGRSVAFARKILQGDWAGLLAQASYWFVRDCVICLDDIERCPLIDGSTIMGFIDELRSRRCKVVLILNRDKAAEDVCKYWEKVVDIDLQLSPSVEQNAEIIFGPDFSYPQYAEAACALLKSLACNNIRIYKRISWLISEVAELLADLRELVQRQVIEHATLFTWLLLHPDVDIPEKIILSNEYEQMFRLVAAERESADQLNEQEKDWVKLVERTGFQGADYDASLFSLINSGWYDEALFRQQLDAVNSAEAQQAARDRISEIAQDYASAFNLSQEDYLDRLSAALHEEIDRLDIYTFDFGILLLEKLGRDAAELAQDYLACHNDYLDEVAQARRYQSIDHPVLAQEIARREGENRLGLYDLDTVTAHLLTRSGYGQNQVKYLSSLEPEDYLSWIQSKPERLIEKIKAILERRETDDFRQAANALTAALRSIAKQNEFNAQRIRESYGISLDANKRGQTNDRS